MCDTYSCKLILLKFLTPLPSGAEWITTVLHINYFLGLTYLKIPKEIRYHNFYHFLYI
jgi:hypothetical protein